MQWWAKRYAWLDTVHIATKPLIFQYASLPQLIEYIKACICSGFGCHNNSTSFATNLNVNVRIWYHAATVYSAVIFSTKASDKFQETEAC